MRLIPFGISLPPADSSNKTAISGSLFPSDIAAARVLECGTPPATVSTSTTHDYLPGGRRYRRLG